MSEKIGVFEFVKSISTTKKKFTDEQINTFYNPYITARTLANYMDTVLLVNEINTLGVQISPKEHFEYLFHSVRKKFRYTDKIEKDEININKTKIIAEYFNYSFEKASSVLKIFSDEDIKQMKKTMEDFGGIIK